ncbi:GGDEF domain-containing protein [Paenibacillus sp. IB182496]|uniref:GGDEF domain-containing protein n=1 Tax=Paenibacillus sabuli TaxID=2772509 RepID=A0A927BUD9_9BACL|nr:GGDEF domain-containing protein [Paenibacillus sabuli]MBD2846502.1 GGDEF domain-containing protein [Paenibacillus sabuli]
MKKYGNGLLDRKLLRELALRQSSGTVGLLYVQLAGGGDNGRTIIREWAREQPQLFWWGDMGADACLLLHVPGRDNRALTALLQASRLTLGTRLQALDAPPLLGDTVIAHAGRGHSPEREVLEGIIRARARALRTAESAKEAAGGGASGSEAAEGEALDSSRLWPDRSAAPGGAQIGSLAAVVPTFGPQARVSELARLFEGNARIQGAVIAEHRRPIGLVMKEKLHQLLAGQYGLSLYWDRPVSRIMDKQPLIVEASAPVEQVSQLAMDRDYGRLYDIVLITRAERLIGAASIRAILESITSLRTEAARTASPLTGLPGNGPIRMELERRIRGAESFAVIYADLDCFKWYNDGFGFHAGDELIRFTARVLQAALPAESGAFLGHIGGDDFIAVLAAADGEAACREAIRRFEAGVGAYYGAGPLPQTTDREGRALDRNGVALSLSLLACGGGGSERPTPERISREAAALKKRAKAEHGSVYVAGRVGGNQHGEGRL